jgi:molecular chaperone DnaK
LIQVVLDSNGDRTLPSVMAITPDGATIVGREAMEKMQKNPANTFHSVKRFIGMKHAEVTQEAAAYSYKVHDIT